ncbi:MAG: inositol monophosphatase family protein, partial [Pseudomonadota bacterium]
MLRSALMTIMTNAARKGARAIIRDFGEVENLQVSRKGPGDYVTATDRKVEKVIRDELEKAREGYGFLMEESGIVEGSDKTHRWILDPIDGTTNFMHGLPHFSISLALEREGQLVAGLVYNPISDEMFWAEKGKGAFVNEKRIRVAARRDLNDCIITMGIPHLGRGDQVRHLCEMEHIMPQVAGLRRFGSAALDLAYVASGRCDAFFEHGLSAWDMAAGILLVREAGGFVTNAEGKK